MEGREATRATGSEKKPKAAASLTADVVARGRQRKQAYGEAGLWRGVAVPPPEEAPVRMVLPPVRERGASARNGRAVREARVQEPVRERLALNVEPEAPQPPPAREFLDPNAAPEAPKDMGDLAFYVAGAALLAVALYLLGLLFL